MCMFLYHFLWTVALVFLAPVVGLLGIGSMARGDHSGLEGRLMARLAWRLPNPPPEKGGIWVHALSVGEVISALPLVDRLSKGFPGRDIVFTATTAAGLSVAREKLDVKVRLIFPMPVDAWWAVRRVVHFVNPSVFVLIETDIWPGLLGGLKRKGIQSILANGRVSPRTFRSYKRAPCVVRKMFDPLDVCLMQSDLDRDRLLMIGVDKSKVITAGNIKFDRQMDAMGEEERQRWLSTLGLEPEDPLWVAGSTHKGEEEVLLDVFKRLSVSFPRLRLILAPRDTGRAGDILAMAGERGFRALLKTQVTKQRAGCREQSAEGRAQIQLATPNLQPSVPRAPCPMRHAPSANHSGYDVLVLDTMGELGRIYGVGSVGFVGGSLVPVGGHNLLEPASFGIPVIFGPHTHNFVSMAAALVEAGGGCRVHNDDELTTTLEAFLKDEEMRTRAGARARAFAEENQGAVERVFCQVKRCMGQKGA
ncbi:MAG: 3-deoxy-D-manno-octulosonic acid transferase [Thermodesulfobacteriota bacterium]|nr:3-deoxy-D-manno-octulosonic acid transferase [Thermodesulfobacteriota bacterium]